MFVVTTRPAASLALLLLLSAGGAAVSVAAPANAADSVKPGRWEFTSQMQAPAMPQLPPGTQLPPGIQLQPGGGMKVSHTSCVDPERAVPTDPRPECKIDRMERNGGTVSWATTCNTAQGTVRSEGIAHYAGDNMQATLTTHIPQQGGRSMDTSQRISGRYLGPCAAPR
jgi:hypothetical protein